MTLSSVSQSSLATTQHKQQAETNTAQTTNKRAASPAANTASGNKIDDNVTLTKAGSGPAVESVGLDAAAAEKLQVQVSSAILAQSKTAVSTQANMSPQGAQNLLAD